MRKSKGMRRMAKGGMKMMKANKGNIATMSLAQAKKVLKANNMKAVKIKK